jgi:hypothetical protein
MQNAHERFGSLEFIKRTKDSTTRVRVHVDRAVLEPAMDERGQASAHLISMIGGDSENRRPVGGNNRGSCVSDSTSWTRSNCCFPWS